MNKTLKVIQPFFVMDEGDTFELQDNGMYTSSYTEEFSATGIETDGTVDSNYRSNYSISESFAKKLINDGYLQEVTKTADKKEGFVNIFDEIERLFDKYATELENLDTDLKDAPTCVKVEKETVLRNLTTVLNHLYSLKK